MLSPAGAWCRHCDVGHGCKIYEDRPQGCRKFDCGWLKIDSLKSHWYPRVARMVLDVRLLVEGNKREAMVVIHVDPQYRHRLKEKPWVDDIRTMAREFRVLIKLAGPASASPGSAPSRYGDRAAATDTPSPIES